MAAEFNSKKKRKSITGELKRDTLGFSAITHAREKGLIDQTRCTFL
jgi:hypothetical protein